MVVIYKVRPFKMFFHKRRAGLSVFIPSLLSWSGLEVAIFSVTVIHPSVADHRLLKDVKILQYFHVVLSVFSLKNKNKIKCRAALLICGHT